MSNPLPRLEHLDIHDMAETRSQRHRGQRGAARSTSNRGRARGRGRGAAPSLRVAPPIRGRSIVEYNVQELSPDSSACMTEGLETDFQVDRLLSYPFSNPTYYAFQLKKPVSVRIHDPSTGLNRVECSCGGGNQCCIHIYVSVKWNSQDFC